MDIADSLTCMWLRAQTEKRALDLPALRDQFDQSTTREKSLRRQADRWSELAQSRAAEEDTSTSGYLDTAANRMLVPIPHTAGEGVIRGLATVGGAVAGHGFGKSLETLHPGAVGQHVGMMKDLNVVSGNPELDRLRKALLTSSPEGIADALNKRTIKDVLGKIHSSFGPSAEVAELRAAMDGVKFPNYGGARAQVSQSILDNKKLKDLVGSKLPRYGGAIAGALGAAALSGLPYALRALYQKGQGGEAAVRARDSANDFKGQADYESTKRDALLNQLASADK